MKKFFLNLFLIFVVIPISVCIEYTVQKGDCLWNIALQYYGDPYMWRVIYHANIDKIENPDLIYPGQIFYLPETDIADEVKTIVATPEEYELKEEIREKQCEDKLQPVFPKTVSIEDFKEIGEIVAGKEEKFVYIDYDIVKVELKQGCSLEVGQVVGVYHKGPSPYDLNLFQVKPDQLNLVAKARVINLQGEVLCEIIRAYSPVTIGDLITIGQLYQEQK